MHMIKLVLNWIRFDGEDFLERFRDKRIMFVGDSLSLNQWQSLTCMIHATSPQSGYIIKRIGGSSTFTLKVIIFNLVI